MRTNYIPDTKPPKQQPKRTMGVEVSIVDMDIFKSAMDILIGLIQDKRVLEDIRYEYLNKVMGVVDVKDYHIEL